MGVIVVGNDERSNILLKVLLPEEVMMARPVFTGQTVREAVLEPYVTPALEIDKAVMELDVKV